MSSKALPLLLETVKIEDGIVFNLPYHQDRCNSSRKELYGSNDILSLSDMLTPPKKGLYRCRILYGIHVQSIEYISYVPKKIFTLKVVPSNLDYDFKYANRTSLEKLLIMHSNFDEIIIEKEGYITDTTISNIAFFDGEHWITPQKPLLKGTMRQKLLDEGHLIEKMIKKEDIKGYKNVALINAMIGFNILNPVKID